MTTAELYNYLNAKFQQEPFLLSRGELTGLSAQLDVAAAVEAIRCYFPEGGAIRLANRKPVDRPAEGKRIEVAGLGSRGVFAGMAVRLELWTEQKTGGGWELHLTVSASGASPNSKWTLGEAIPFYQGSLFDGLRFALIDDPNYPFITLSSHPSGDGAIPSLFLKGFLELNSIAEASPSLFLGSDTQDKQALILGVIGAFDPWAAPDDQDFRPSVSIFSGLPDPPEKRKLAGLFPIDNVRFILDAKPEYDLAARQWYSQCSYVWSADLELKPAITGNNASPAYKMPVGVQITHKQGRIRIWSNLTDALALAWDALAGIIPGVRLSLPDTGFQLRDYVKLTKLEFIADHTADRGIVLDSISLNIQTSDSNRWDLIEGLLTLDAIDFFILVKNPLGAAPGVYFTLTGLVGIGPKATLQLTGDLSLAGGQTDYGFSGHLSDDEPLEINEVLAHFLGHSNYPAIPKITVEEFSFTVRPRSRFYEGEITLSGDWPLLPDSQALTLRQVYFKMSHTAGEGGTAFVANGVLEIANTPIYLAAEYVSNGQGWTFSGGTFDEEEIPIGEWLDSDWKLWSTSNAPALPDAVKGLTLLNLGMRINTTTRDYSFQGTARFPIDGNINSTSKAELTVQVDREGESARFSGILTLLDRDFEVVFNNAGLLVATYDGSGAKPIDLKELVSEISKTIGDKIAAGISINLSSAQLAFLKGPVHTKFLFGVGLDAGIQLSNLPVVGFLFSPDQTLNVSFQLLAVNRAFDKSEIQTINELTGPAMTKMPEQRIGGGQDDQADFSLKAAVRFAGSTHQLALPVQTDVSKTPDSKKLPVTPTASTASMATYWVKIDKALGPFHFQRLGIGSDGTDVAFLLDARLQTAGLTIALDGLEARCKFADLSRGEFHPNFSLRGLGIAFKSGDLEIAGALLHRPAPAKDAYDGAVVLRYKRLAIEAAGSYETIDGRPALFIYALIDYPLGGPSFFFVEGGALGFGYNRSFTMPTIEQVGEFPLVKQALSPSKSKLMPMDLAEQLRPYVKPAVGEYFIAAGVKFSSFKTIKGFVLLTIVFGKHFEIDVLGKATLTSPSGVDSDKALMSATLLLLGRFLPEEGLLMVMAQLAPDARLFAPDCHLSGGFALYCWFGGKHKGDFVLTLGGYHKSFLVPDHYPKVPRLAMNWQVNPNLSLKAEAYFALTPSALMAGGKLEVNWQSGDLQAWLRAEIDFLIGWQPFYYDGHAYVAIGARYRFEFFGKHEISVELTAQLDLWGPPFSGRARVQWNLLSFEVAFGDKERHQPKPLDWPSFRKAFLPLPEERMFTVTAEAGKVAQGDGTTRADAASLGYLNPRNLCIVVRSPLPIKEPKTNDPRNNLLRSASEVPRETTLKEPDLGIAPMNKTADQWEESLVSITIFRRKDANTKEDVSSQFQATRIRNNVPASLWGETMDPKARKQDAPQLLADAICGYEIRLSKPVKEVELKPFTLTGAAQSGNLSRPAVAAGIETISTKAAKDIAAVLLDVEVRKRRSKVLNDLLPQVDVDWTSVTVASWRGRPSIIKSSTLTDDGTGGGIGGGIGQ
jgi:hypothetical protein